MGRVVLAAAATVLLALPAAASASAAGVAARNAAFTCRVLRDTHPVGFVQAFGTYRRCVARQARPLRKHPPLTITLHNLTLATGGTVTAADANAGCRQSAFGCTLAMAGGATGLLGGSYSTSWSVLWSQPSTNFAGGFCAPATGTVTLTLPALGTLVVSSVATVCEVGPTGANVGHTLNRGKYVVAHWQGGTTGAFRRAGGAGSVSFVQQPGPSSALGGSVSGAFEFSALRLTF
jgi:hypothetical protein